MYQQVCHGATDWEGGWLCATRRATEIEDQRPAEGGSRIWVPQSPEDAGGPWPSGGADSSPEPLWLEHPVPKGKQELIWAIRLPAVSDVMSPRRPCPLHWHLPAARWPCVAERRSGDGSSQKSTAPRPVLKSQQVLEAQGGPLPRDQRNPGSCFRNPCQGQPPELCPLT